MLCYLHIDYIWNIKKWNNYHYYKHVPWNYNPLISLTVSPHGNVKKTNHSLASILTILASKKDQFSVSKQPGLLGAGRTLGPLRRSGNLHLGYNRRNLKTWKYGGFSCPLKVTSSLSLQPTETFTHFNKQHLARSPSST
jgi:hypothetical protein